MKALRIFLISAFFVLVSQTIHAQTVLDMTLDNFKGQKFSDVQKKSKAYIDECTSLATRGQLPKFDNSYQGQEYQVILHQAKTGTCDNKAWSDDIKRLCLQSIMFHLKTEKDLQKFLEDAQKLNVRSKSVRMAHVIFYKDPSLCDAFLKNQIFDDSTEEDKQVSYSICQAVTTPAGINACLENFEEGSNGRKYCVEGFTLYQAFKTKDINECSKISIRDDMLRLQCEALVDPGSVEKRIIRHYTENQCYKAYAIPLAVVGTLDPNGPDDPVSYCYKIRDFHEVDFNKCRELVYQAREFVKQQKASAPPRTDITPSP